MWLGVQALRAARHAPAGDQAGLSSVVMTVLWLGVYCLIASRAAETLRQPRVKAALDRVTGVALIAIGLRVVAERR